MEFQIALIAKLDADYYDTNFGNNEIRAKTNCL